MPWLRPQTVLLVDRDVDTLTQMEAAIGVFVEGARLVTARSAEEALDRVRHEQIDVVLAERDLPRMDGIALLNSIRMASPTTARVLVAEDPEAPLTADAINRAHIEHVLAKPLDGYGVAVVVQRILHRRRAEALRQRAFARSREILRREAAGGRHEAIIRD